MFVRLQAKGNGGGGGGGYGRADVVERAQRRLGASKPLVQELDVGQGDGEMETDTLAGLIGSLDVVVAPLASVAAELAASVGTRVLAFAPSLHTEHTVGAFLGGGGGGGGKDAAHPWHANAAGGVELYVQEPAWSGGWAGPFERITKVVRSLAEDVDAGFGGLDMDDDFMLG